MQRRSRVFRGVDLKVRNPQVAKPRRQGAVLDASHLDEVPGDSDLQRLFLPFPDDGQSDVSAWLAAHAADRLAEGQALHRRLVQANDQVPRLDARLLRRRVVYGGDDLDEAVLHAHFDAQAAELAGGAFLQRQISLLVQVGRMGIQPLQQTLDGAFQQVGVSQFFHIVLFDLGEHFREGSDLIDRQGLRRRLLLLGGGETGHAA